jgi:serine/threonine-protein kinase HipA
LGTMTLAAKAGIRVPDFRLESAAARAVFLIKRFDRDDGRRLPFMSAFALSNLNIDELERGSYPEIATRMRKFVSHVQQDHHELFRRMVFNMFDRNEDDHLRNHGFIFNGAWMLSPAYDIVPVPSRRKKPRDTTFHLSLHVGDQGWEQELNRAGVSRNDREAVRWCFEGFRKGI